MTDRRTLGRYSLSLPVRIRPPGKQKPMWANSQTRDILAEGVYIRAWENISVGSQVELSFAMPESFTRGAKVFIQALGRASSCRKAGRSARHDRSRGDDRAIGYYSW